MNVESDVRLTLITGMSLLPLGGIRSVGNLVPGWFALVPSPEVIFSQFVLSVHNTRAAGEKDGISTNLKKDIQRHADTWSHKQMRVGAPLDQIDAHRWVMHTLHADPPTHKKKLEQAAA